MAVKKLLIVNDLFEGGGVEKLMHYFIDAFHNQMEVTVLVNEKLDNESITLPDNVKRLYRIWKPFSPKNAPETLLLKLLQKLHRFFLRREVARRHFDLAIVMKEGELSKKALEYSVPRKLVWVHTDYNSCYYTDKVFGGTQQELACMKQYEKVICVSRDIAESFRQVVGDPGNLAVYYNPIDVQDILARSREPIDDLDVSRKPGLVRFVSVGRLCYQKGYALLLEACHLLERDGYRFEFWVIGGKDEWNDDYRQIASAIRRLNVKSVQFLGPKSNPHKYMKEADWFFSSSLFEGYSLVSQEAAVLDLPLMLTDCSGVRELIGENNEYGIMMETSVMGIYDGIRNVIDHPELHAHYKQKIMERKQIITFEDRLQKIAELF